MCNTYTGQSKYTSLIDGLDKTYEGSYFQSRGVSVEVFNEFQLGSTHGNSDVHDTHKFKPLVPINDIFGNPVSIVLRLGETGHKYHYYPFPKMKHLFALDKAQEEIRRQNLVYVVEGFFDVLLPFSKGVRNVVAIMGTRMSKQQLYLLSSLTNHITFVLDSDRAGIAALDPTIKLIKEETPDVRSDIVFTYPHKDFADYIQAGELWTNSNQTMNQNM